MVFDKFYDYRPQNAMCSVLKATVILYIRNYLFKICIMLDMNEKILLMQCYAILHHRLLATWSSKYYHMQETHLKFITLCNLVNKCQHGINCSSGTKHIVESKTGNLATISYNSIFQGRSEFPLLKFAAIGSC